MIKDPPLWEILLSKLQMLRAMELSGETSSDIIGQTAKMCLKAKGFIIGKLNAFLKIHHIYQTMIQLTQDILQANEGTYQVSKEV